MSNKTKKQILRDYCTYMIDNRFAIEPDIIKAINLFGKLQRFRFRIDRDKIPDIDKCLANIERKLFKEV